MIHHRDRPDKGQFPYLYEYSDNMIYYHLADDKEVRAGYLWFPTSILIYSMICITRFSSDTHAV